ncbi:methyltransferase [Vallitalea sediminicola]
MKTATSIPKYDASKFMGKTHDFLETQLMYAAIELNLFGKLQFPVTIQELVNQTGYNSRNLELLLNALTAINFLRKEGDKFSNLPETNYYLNPGSKMYVGEHLLYWRDMTNLANVVELVQDGSKKVDFKDQNGSDFFDFRSMNQGARNTMYLGRVQKFISLINRYFDKEEEFKVLDMGGGSGIMSIEIARNFPNAKGVVFDQPFVTELTQEVIEEYKVAEQISTQSGNFVTDSFDDKYDLIIASGVLDFVGDLEKMISKLCDSLNDDGYIYISTHGINEEFTAPKKYILGWLSSHLNGLDILKPDPIIRKTIKDSGLEIIFNDESGLNYMVRKKKYE